MRIFWSAMIDSFLYAISIELKSVVDLIIFNSIILNTYIKINDINGKIDTLRATFNWAIERNFSYNKK